MSPLGFSPRTVRPRPVKTNFLDAGPFVGMRDTIDPSGARPELASLLENVIPVDPDRGSAVIGRPGFRVFGGGRIGTGSSWGQRCYQFTKLNGAEHALAIVGGEIWELDFALRTYTLRISRADLTAASITFDTTGLAFCVTFADLCIIKDMTHRPWSWDGTPHGGLANLTSTHTGGWYGQQVVYYGKLFGIRTAERNTFEWSEENQPNVGYETGGFLNVWTLGQTDQEPIFALMPTNEQLGVFRARSATAVGGAVTEDFKASGTRESLSDTIGTMSPAAWLYLNDHDGGQGIYFYDADLRPHVWTPGAGITPVYADFYYTIRLLDSTKTESACSVYSALSGRVFMAAIERERTFLSILLGIEPRSAQSASCVIRGFPHTAIDTVKNHRGKNVIVHLTSDGFIYDHGLENGEVDEEVWDDHFADGVQPVRHIIIGPYLGFDAYYEKFFDRIDFSFRAPNNLTSIVVTLNTPYRSTPPQTFGFLGVGNGIWDSSVWDIDDWGGNTAFEAHQAIGVKEWGRWAQWTVEHAGIDERFGLLTARLRSFIRGPFPRTP